MVIQFTHQEVAMDYQPPQSEVLALQGEGVKFAVEYEEGLPAEGPTFFLNGEVQPTLGIGGDMGVTIGVEKDGKIDEKEIPMDMSSKSSSTIHFEKTGINTVTAIWGNEHGIDLREEVQKGVDELSTECTTHNWQVHVVNQDTTLGELRKIVEGITEFTAIYAAEKAIDHILKERTEREEEKQDASADEENEEDFFQDKITNYPK